MSFFNEFSVFISSNLNVIIGLFCPLALLLAYNIQYIFGFVSNPENHQNNLKAPKYFKSIFFWVVIFFACFFDAAMIKLYELSGSNLNPMLTLHLAVITPTTIIELMKKKPGFIPENDLEDG